MLKLNVGCGGDIRDGYENIDYYCCGAVSEGDYDSNGVRKINIENLHNYYKPESVDEIVAQDVLEHFQIKRSIAILQQLSILLKRRGIIRIRVPDAMMQAKCLIDKVWDIKTFNHMFFAPQDHDGNVHKCCFTMDYLCELLQNCGLFIEGRRFINHNLCNDVNRSFNANIEVVARK